MKITDSPKNALSRRAWLILTGGALSGCGGGGSSLLTNFPGTGGTGAPLFAQGSISGFGSVIINGIKFDDSKASAMGNVRIDGLVATSTDLRLGMVAGVQGERNASDASLGVANAIEVWSIAQGQISSVTASSFDLMGMVIQTDTNTSLEGVDAASALTVGQSVMVWGLQAGSDGTLWNATRVLVTNSSTQRVITGFVKESHDDLTLNGWQLSGPAAKTLEDDHLVRVEGVMGAGKSLSLTSTKVMSSGFEEHAAGSIEIEGVVTSLLGASQFMMGNIKIDASSAAMAAKVSQLAVGGRLEVYGNWVSGVLVVSNIKLESHQGHEIEVEIEARIEQFTSLANFVLRGQRCDASNAQFLNGTSANLKQGLKVKVTGSKAGAVLLVKTLKFET